MKAPRFTIVMPTHYRPDVIGYAIQSVLDQTEPDFELLVVGDGADARTAEVVLGFTDPRVRWFDLPKAPGYGYANRNRALAESSGEFIAYAADDDIMLPDHLERLGAMFAEDGVQWAYSQAIWVSPDGIAAPDLTNLDFADEREFLMTRHNTISGGAIVFRASAFDTRMAWPEDRTQEADLHMLRSLISRHGIGAMRRPRLPTFFHFTAGQKSNRDSNFPLLGAFLELADSSDWWPAELRTDAAVPQAEYLRRLRETPGYLEKLRGALTDIVNRAALDALAPRTPQPPNAERAALTAEIDALRASTSWRMTAPIRHLVESLRGSRR